MRLCTKPGIQEKGMRETSGIRGMPSDIPGNALKHSGEYRQTIFHFLLRKIFETYQVYYTALLIYRFRMHFYP